MRKLRPLSPTPSRTQSPEPSSTEPRSDVPLQLRRLRPLSPTSPRTPSTEPLRLPPLNSHARRILCFDIENKPGTYGPGDYTHPKVTAIAAQFLDEDRVYSWCLERDKPGRVRDDADQFRAMWVDADIVMGHNIKRHDVRILNGLFALVDQPPLPARGMIDTYGDAVKTVGFSRSLENQCARWGCPIQKVWVPEHIWEQANDGVPDAVAHVRHRCETDVRMNVWLHGELRRRRLLVSR
jgi:hypothetical protein